MNERIPAFFRNRRSLVRLGLVTAVMVMLACSTYQMRFPPVPLPAQMGNSINLQGTQMAARAYVDADEAEKAFGFDIRGAGLMPVSFAVDNRSRNVVRINPQQTFLIDQKGMAWPLLTSDQAQARVADSVKLGETLKSGALSALMGASTGAITGFAIGLVLQDGFGPMLNKAGVGAGAGALLNGPDAHDLELRIRKDLANRSLRSQRVQPGDLAQGYLFFPGQDEAEGATSLRLGLELDGYPEIATLPLAMPAPVAPVRSAPPTAAQPRPTAR